MSDLPDALTAFDSILDVGGHRRPALFLDYDGTLTPIVARPELAQLDPSMKTRLAELAARMPVAVVTGRDVTDARAKIGIDTLYYAGSHGHLIEGPGGFSRECGQEFLPDLDRARAMLDEALGGVDGTLVERKRYSVAVHVRQVGAGDMPRVHAAIRRVLAEMGRLRLGHGKKVFEIRPRMDWDKGRAVLWLLEALEATRGPLWPIYVGDDITDEDAFAALKGRGSTIVVGQLARETAAGFSLADVAAVGRFLDRLLERAPRAGKVA